MKGETLLHLLCVQSGECTSSAHRKGLTIFRAHNLTRSISNAVDVYCLHFRGLVLHYLRSLFPTMDVTALEFITSLYSLDFSWL